MKKIIKIAVFVIIIILLAQLLINYMELNVSAKQLANYSSYYFNQLQLDEKKMYVKIDEGIKKNKEKIFLGKQDSTNATEKITKVIRAYFRDNPQCFYVSNQYIISSKNILFLKYTTLKLDYLVNGDDKIYSKTYELEAAVDRFLAKNIRAGMTDYEKEIAIHDALVNHVKYYEYEDINQIPPIKHTAYAALIEGEAVCDGYANALKLLLDKVGIENIVVGGMAGNVAHAWNIVKIDNEYYNVDATSNKVEEDYKTYVMHKYFNVTDESIKKSHSLDSTFTYPECTSTEYDYYLSNGFYVYYEDNLEDKLSQIIKKQQTTNTLEVKLDDRYYVQTIIDMLYDLNFNNWRSSGKTKITYSRTDNVYVFPK